MTSVARRKEGPGYSSGASFAILLGASMFFGEHIGVNLETGLQARVLSYSPAYFGTETTVTISEWTVLNANVVFAL